MSQLLPEGIEHLGDCPFPLYDAINMALRFLHYEEFPTEERPPRRIWLDSDKLGEWWEEVERVRKEKYGGSASEEDEDEEDQSHNAVELITRGG